MYQLKGIKVDATEPATMVEEANFFNLLQAGKAEFEAKDYKTALELFIAAESMMPHHVEVITYKAKCQHKIAEIAKAEKEKKEKEQLEEKSEIKIFGITILTWVRKYSRATAVLLLLIFVIPPLSWATVPELVPEFIMQSILKLVHNCEEVGKAINGRRAIKKGDKWGYVTTRGFQKVMPIYDEAADFSKQGARVKLNGKYGVIDSEGKVQVPIKLDKLPSVITDEIEATMDGETFKINPKGDCLNNCPDQYKKELEALQNIDAKIALGNIQKTAENNNKQSNNTTQANTETKPGTEKQDEPKSVIKEDTEKSTTTHLELPKPSPDLIKNEMIRVEGGTFIMGCTDEQGSDCGNNEKPAHQVTVKTFYIDATEVTNAQYCDFLNARKASDSEVDKWIDLAGSSNKISKEGGIYKVESGYENHPVIYVSWYGADAYAKYNAKRLPTEAEWEYAARGGNQNGHYKYSGSNSADAVAWYRSNGDGTKEVGTKIVNELGMYDMSGNVWEWVQDCYHSDYNGATIDGSAWTTGDCTSRVLRGGSWLNYTSTLRVSSRSNYTSSNGNNHNGFRCARTP